MWDDPDVLALAVAAILAAVVVGILAWLSWRDRRSDRRSLDRTIVKVGSELVARIESLERDIGKCRGDMRSLLLQVIDHDIRDEQRHAQASRDAVELQQRVADLDRDLLEMASELAAMAVRVARLNPPDDPGPEKPDLGGSIWHSPS